MPGACGILPSMSICAVTSSMTRLHLDTSALPLAASSPTDTPSARASPGTVGFTPDSAHAARNVSKRPRTAAGSSSLTGVLPICSMRAWCLKYPTCSSRFAAGLCRPCPCFCMGMYHLHGFSTNLVPSLPLLEKFSLPDERPLAPRRRGFPRSLGCKVTRFEL